MYLEAIREAERRLLAQYCWDGEPRYSFDNLTDSEEDHERLSISQKNGRESRLFQLPPEIRRQIYTYALGGEVHHVRAADVNVPPGVLETYQRGRNFQELLRLAMKVASPPVNVVTCYATVSEKEAYCQAVRADQTNAYGPQDSPTETRYRSSSRLGETHYIGCCVQRHERCYAVDNNEGTADLRLLRVCHQIYEESQYIPFEANTFSFNDPRAFLAFLLSIGPERASHLRTLHLQLYANIPSRYRSPQSPAQYQYLTCRDWEYVFNFPNLVSSLTGLRTLHVSISIPFVPDFKFGTPWGLGRHRLTSAGVPEDRWLAGVMTFAKLPLKEVTVIISDHYKTMFGCQGWSDIPSLLRMNAVHLRDRFCLTAQEKRRWANSVRERLLHIQTAACRC